MDLIDLLEYMEDDGHRELKKYLVDVKNPLEYYCDEDFIKRYRFSKKTVLYLHGIIKQDDELDTRCNGLPSLLQLVCALRFYAAGHFQITDGDLMGISRCTAMRSVHKVTRAICRKKSRFIGFPTDLARVKRQFYEIASFPNVVGAIDCTHVPIKSPGGDYAELFRNRKGYFSLNVQMICDAQRIVTRWQGSTHDSRIFANSRICDSFEERQIDGFLLGDSGYPSKPYLLTPVPSVTTRAEGKYNRSHIKTRVRIEQCFGVLKKRFHVLASPLRTRLDNTTNIIVAVTCLHNLAIYTKQPEPDYSDYLADEADRSEVQSTSSGSGEAVRRRVIERYFSQ